MSSAVRCAVVGLGMGSGHAKGYLECPDAKLVAVCDLDPKRLEKFKDSVPAGGMYSDHKKMLKEVKPDLVSVALPNFLHAPISIDALKAGAHVLCEKPMAMTVKQAEGMLRVAEKARRKLGINLSYRFTGPARALKDLADTGFLGQAYHAHTRWTRRDGFPGFGGWFGQKKLSGGGPLIDLGVHRIDMAIWLMGSPEPVSVSGSAHYRVGVPRAKKVGKAYDCEDLAAGYIRFKNGASLVFEISWGNHQATREKMGTEVIGTQGALVHRNEGEGYDFVGEYFHEVNGHKLNGRVHSPSGAIANAYVEMVRAVKNDTKPLADGHDGLRIQKILNGLYKSAEIGREVRL
ncbi:MAG: Gfo/Idh/MocA family oxidoreductase [Planctomycetota bacterium]|nr:Gfo/Idh/MocA family oxidoreductase [Planctomycetota bacterium]